MCDNVGDCSVTALLSSVRRGRRMLELPDELIHLIAHTHLADPSSILSLALTCSHLYHVLLSHPHDVAIAKSLYGTLHCISHQWWLPARLSLSRSRSFSFSSHLSSRSGSGFNHSDLHLLSILTATAKHLALTPQPCPPFISFVLRLLSLLDSAVDSSVDFHPISSPASSRKVSSFLSMFFQCGCSHGYLALVSAILALQPRLPLVKLDNPNYGLFLAAKYDRADVVSTLLAHPLTPSSGEGERRVFDPSARNGKILIEAAKHGCTHTMAILLSDQHQVPHLYPRSRPGVHNGKALQAAVEHGQEGVVGLLLGEPGLDSVVSHPDLLKSAAAAGHTSVVRVLLDDSRVDPSVESSKGFRWAAQNGHSEVVSLLLSDSRVDPSAASSAALRWAAGNGHQSVVELLLEDGRADPCAEGNQALVEACRYGFGDVVEQLLLDPRVDVCQDAVEVARQESRVDILRLLSHHSSNVDEHEHEQEELCL